MFSQELHAMCIYKGVEGPEWENLCDKFVKMIREVDVRDPSGNSRAKDAFEDEGRQRKRGDTHYDQSCSTKIVLWEAVRPELWNCAP